MVPLGQNARSADEAKRNIVLDILSHFYLPHKPLLSDVLITSTGVQLESAVLGSISGFFHSAKHAVL